MNVIDLNENVCCRLNSLLEMYSHYDLNTTELNNLYEEYNTESIEYIFADDCEGLENLIMSKDLIKKTDMMFVELEKYSPELDCTEAYVSYKNSVICVSSSRIDDKCICGSTMVYKPEKSQRVCHCGHVENIVAMEARDHSTQSKVSSYNKINRRRNYMLQCIFGIEVVEIPNDLLDYLRQCIKDDQIRNERVNCKLLRKYMERKYADYNANIVKILHLITGIKKYQPTSFEITRILHLHKLACDLYMQLYPGQSVKNPLFFSKTIAIVFQNHKEKENILSNIHKPSESTRRNNEEIWDNIEKHADGQLSII
jgi:hypothetical protein